MGTLGTASRHSIDDLKDPTMVQSLAGTAALVRQLSLEEIVFRARAEIQSHQQLHTLTHPHELVLFRYAIPPRKEPTVQAPTFGHPPPNHAASLASGGG